MFSYVKPTDNQCTLTETHKKHQIFAFENPKSCKCSADSEDYCFVLD